MVNGQSKLGLVQCWGHNRDTGTQFENSELGLECGPRDFIVSTRPFLSDIFCRVVDFRISKKMTPRKTFERICKKNDPGREKKLPRVKGGVLI